MFTKRNSIITVFRSKMRLSTSRTFSAENSTFNHKSIYGQRGSRFSSSRPEKLSVEPSLLEKRLIDAFDVFDNARSHEVDVRELGTIIRSLGCVITEAELQEIQVEVEDVENNCVPQGRFVEYMCKSISEGKFKPADPEDLLKAFQLLDVDNRGYIMKNDLEKALMEVGEPFSKEEINEMMAIACDSETNRINYEHYINLLIVKHSEELNVYSIYEKETAELLAAMPKKRLLGSRMFKEFT